MKIPLPIFRVRTPRARHVPHSALRAPRSFTAFTLIEILVVISIIAILSALILATAGYAMSKARRSRVETERETLIAAIQSYKADKGFYPQDNTLNPTPTPLTVTNGVNSIPINTAAVTPLFYELTGTSITLSGSTPASYYSSSSGDTLTPSQITSVFGSGSSGTGGFVNASTDPSQVKNYFGAASKSARTGKTVVTVGGSAIPVTVFGVTVRGPIQLPTSASSGSISPWSYVSTNPTNNPGSYDLWMDVYYSGKTNRISNWSREPQVQ